MMFIGRHSVSKAAGSTLAFVIVCVAGCGSAANAPGERVGSSENAIQGGKSDTSHNFAVGLCGGAFGGPMGGENCQILCSGALIAPNLVVTARHCVDNVSSDTVDCSSETFESAIYPASEYFITTDPDVFDLSATWYAVTQIVTPTSTKFCGSDLALLILSSNVPSSEAPTLATPEIWYPVYAPQFSSDETAIGYGLDAPDDTTSGGVRRIRENIPILCVPDDTRPAMACAPEKDSGIAAGEFEASNGPCEGDSGSSAYEQTSFDSGTFLSLGILSRGGSSGDTCEGSIYTQLYAWQSLILATVKQAATLGGYPLPAWTTPPAPADAGSPPPANDGGKAGHHPDAAGDGSSDQTQSGDSGGCDAASARPGRGSGWALALALGAIAARRRRRS
jgi:MYXO-CTERM domain-containing protein